MEAALQKIIDSGILGAVLIVSLAGNVYQYKEGKRQALEFETYLKDMLNKIREERQSLLDRAIKKVEGN